MSHEFSFGQTRPGPRELVACTPSGASVERMPTVEAHLSDCADCRQELEWLRPVIDSFVAWPTDLLRPSDRCGSVLHDASQRDGLLNRYAAPHDGGTRMGRSRPRNFLQAARDR